MFQEIYYYKKKYVPIAKSETDVEIRNLDW